eukprot:413590-Prorocentrum_minimum.AAC.1
MTYEAFVCGGSGSGGELFCVGGKNDEIALQTVKRHFLAAGVIKNGYLYTCVGSGTEDRWGEVEPTLRAAVASFQLE